MNKALEISLNTETAEALLTKMYGIMVRIDTQPSAMILQAPAKRRGRPPGKKDRKSVV